MSGVSEIPVMLPIAGQRLTLYYILSYQLNLEFRLKLKIAIHAIEGYTYKVTQNDGWYGIRWLARYEGWRDIRLWARYEGWRDAMVGAIR